MWFSLLVLIPLTAVLVQASAGGWSAYWDALTQPADTCSAQAHRRSGGAGNCGQRDHGHRDRLGASP